MSAYQKLLLEIEERNKKFQEQKNSSELLPEQTEYDDDVYVQQEMEVYQKYLKEGKGRDLKYVRGAELKLSTEDIEDNIKLQTSLNAVSRDVAWVHELSHTSMEDVKIADWDNAIEREMAFYNDTLKTVTLGMQKLKKMGIPSVRPDDYFAEMVKSDDHMGRIKSRILKNKEIIKARIQKRKERDYKKKSKIVQAEALQEKVHKKKEAIAAVEQWRKINRGGSGGGSTFDVKEAEKLYSATKKMSTAQTRAFYKQNALTKQDKTKKGRPGKAARQKSKSRR
mmetsp:Transcript_416/g.1578  ORF Transcript_416/g.1578 Transcript_416/m.1578 type:complete len:281 (-) Transcript_416:45-887(-)